MHHKHCMRLCFNLKFKFKSFILGMFQLWIIIKILQTNQFKKQSINWLELFNFIGYSKKFFIYKTLFEIQKSNSKQLGNFEIFENKVNTLWVLMLCNSIKKSFRNKKPQNFYSFPSIFISTKKRRKWKGKKKKKKKKWGGSRTGPTRPSQPPTTQPAPSPPPTSVHSVDIRGKRSSMSSPCAPLLPAPCHPSFITFPSSKSLPSEP